MMQVVDRDVLSGGQIWLLLKPTTASYTEEWVLEPEAEQPPTPQTEPQMQPAGLSGDSVACQLLKREVAPQQPVPTPETEPEPTPSVESEFDTGRTHGKHDALQGWHPIYSQPTTNYARGYLSGYSAGVNATDEQPKVSLPVEWSLTWNQRWGWYDVWVGHRCIGRAATEESAERMATKRIALDEMIERQNRAVMKALCGQGNGAMKTIATTDGYSFTQQPDGTWLGGMGDIYDYPPDHQHFYHIETGSVVLLPPGEFVESDRLLAFGISTTPTFIYQGAQLTYDQLASMGWMECAAP